MLDRGADDTARFSIFRDGAEDGEVGDEVFRVDENGNVYARGAFRPSAMDLAEYFPVTVPVSVGDVLAIDPDTEDGYRPAAAGAGDAGGRWPRATRCSRPALLR